MEKFQRVAWRSFSIQKIILQILDFNQGFFGKKYAIQFSENEGGGQRPFGTFPKIHP